MGARRAPVYLSTAHSRWDDNCGCAMGARFLAVALLVSALWYLLHWNARDLSFKTVLARIFLWSFLAAGLGKILGLLLSRMRARYPALRELRFPGS